MLKMKQIIAKSFPRFSLFCDFIFGGLFFLLYSLWWIHYDEVMWLLYGFWVFDFLRKDSLPKFLQKNSPTFYFSAGTLLFFFSKLHLWYVYILKREDRFIILVFQMVSNLSKHLFSSLFLHWFEMLPLSYSKLPHKLLLV